MLVGMLGLSLLPAASAAFTPEELPQVGYHPSSSGTVLFANALSLADRWRVVKPNPGGGTLQEAPLPDQVDVLGNPIYLQSGQTYFLANPGGSDRVFYEGRIVLTWEGDADIRVQNGTFVAPGQNTAGQPQSTGVATGSLLNGTRVYAMGTNPNGAEVRVYAITDNPAQKPRNIRLWLADPSTGQSLIGQTFHPRFLARVNDRSWGYIRFMGWGHTNSSPQQDWFDRRRPEHTFQNGVINPRSSVPGGSSYYAGPWNTGVAFEHMVALCNLTNKHLWINVPHLATDDFVTKLARLIRYGSDANGDPYTSTVSNPVHPPLNSGLKVYVEYSNEIWSTGASSGFGQGRWAEMQAAALGITKPQFNARRFCDVWRIFQGVFGSADRVVRVAAIHTASESYTTGFLNEIKAYGPTLSPAVEPDLISPTTYFGNGIQDWAHQRAIAQAGTADEWFYTTETFDHDNRPETPGRPVSKPLADPYWSSADFTRHMDEAFDEWTRRQLSDSSVQGGGFDATGVGGGFHYWLRALAQTTFATPKPLVAYEGGPSLYTDYLDGGDARDDGITRFILEMNRRERIKEVYRTHLNLAKAKGLWSHMMFTDASSWSKYGQWGHLERYSQDPASSPKYAFLLEWVDTDTNGLRHIDRVQGAAPAFVTAAELPQATVGRFYSRTIETTGGNGTRSVQVVASSLMPGLGVAASGGSLTISGTPAAIGSSYVYARVEDGNGDPAWRTFTLRVVQRSADPSVTVDFEDQPMTNGTPLAEPYDVSGYRFTSYGTSAGNALVIHGAGTDWRYGGWASNVLNGRSWGSSHRIARADGRPFDLHSIDLAMQGDAGATGSARITGYTPGGIKQVLIVNLPMQKQPMTTVVLDWITVEKVEIEWRELADGAGGGRTGAIDNLVINTPPVETWVSQDVGSPGVAGSAGYDAGTDTFSIQGGGSDIFGKWDRFHYVTREEGLSGDGEIIARVVSQQNTHDWAKAGVMIRETLAGDSRYALVAVTPGKRVAYERRAATAASASSNNVQVPTSTPRWVRLVRSGDTFTAYQGTDGVTWSQVGPATTLAMGADVQIGLAVCAHDNATLSAVVMDNVRVIGASTGDLIVDNDSATFTGTWGTSSWNTGQFYGADYRHSTGSGATATFTPAFSQSGAYQVYAMWNQGADRAATAPYVITHAGGSTTVVKNQRTDGGQWVYLGTFVFNAGADGKVTVSTAGAGGIVIADAVKFQR